MSGPPAGPWRGPWRHARRRGEPGRPLRAVLATALLLGAAHPGGAAHAGPRQWQETPERLLGGRADGIAVSADGRLAPAPPLGRLADLAGLAGERAPAQTWALAVGPRGRVHVGTGPDGRILRLDGPEGAATTLFTVAEPMVTALAFLPDGDLLAGTAPEGRVYRISPDGGGTVWAETGQRYVWALAAAADGTVWAATGDSGGVVWLDRSGEPHPFFEADEPHLRCLALLPGGELLAGGSGRGLVYRIDAEGHGLVLHDDPLEEVAAIAALEDGSTVAALVAAPEAPPPRAAVRLRLPDGPDGGAGAGEPVPLPDGEDAERLVQGIIEGLGERPQATRDVRGRVVRIDPEGRAETLWTSTTEAPLALSRGAGGEIVFGTGEPARVYRLGEDGRVWRLATLGQAQVTALASVAGGRLVLATSNPAAVYRLGEGGASEGLFVSPALDSGGVSRWGALRWRQQAVTGAGPARIELYTRTGNSERPDETWSGWSPAQTDPQGATADSPEGRFLQWRARLPGDGAGAEISAIRLSYEPLNRAPRLEELARTSAGGAAGPLEVRWRAGDADGDPLEVRLEYRPEGSDGAFTLAGREVDPAPEDGRTARGGRLSWETGDVPEGRYELRATVSDAAAWPPGEGHEVRSGQRLFHTVDRTPPALSVRQAGDAAWEVTLTDELSGAARLELLQGGEVRSTPRPTDGVADEREERFRFALPPAGGEDGWTVRGWDAAGNAAERGLTGD